MIFVRYSYVCVIFHCSKYTDTGNEIFQHIRIKNAEQCSLALLQYYNQRYNGAEGPMNDTSLQKTYSQKCSIHYYFHFNLFDNTPSQSMGAIYMWTGHTTSSISQQQTSAVYLKTETFQLKQRLNIYKYICIQRYRYLNVYKIFTTFGTGIHCTLNKYTLDK